jgi:probable aminopeptidase NPEPL1
VHTFLSGKTVEVNNTDAEGRLVLADGCYYAASRLNPTIIIDMATLTGAQGIATGAKHGAIYCSDESLESLALTVGKATGDLVFPVPYCPEFYRAEFKSVVSHLIDIDCFI